MSYRDLDEALRARRNHLTEELAELEQESRAFSTLEARRREAERELSDVDAALGQRRLPLLQRIRVASPCSASWQDMSGDERRRLCGKCDKHVYNLSAMTPDEVEALVFETEGKVCVRFYQRPDGSVMTADCAVGVKRKRRRVLAAVSLAAAAAAGVGGALGFGGPGVGATMGELEVVQPPIMGSAAVIPSMEDLPPRSAEE